MASTLAGLLLLSACLFTVTVGFGEDCRSYLTSNNELRSGISCYSWQHCCGTCDNRYCCSSEYSKLSETDQNFCNFKNSGVAIGLTVVGVVVLIIVFITCCCCPCCCIYQMCRKPRPVVGTQVTAVTNMQCIQQQQPVMQGGQYPQYQPVPTQQGYGGQPMQTGPYQGQPYAPGPPPPYHIAMSPGYPTSQSAYGGGQAMYLTQPPAQPSVAYMPSETLSQPAYNPAYMQPPKTCY